MIIVHMNVTRRSENFTEMETQVSEIYWYIFIKVANGLLLHRTVAMNHLLGRGLLGHGLGALGMLG